MHKPTTDKKLNKINASIIDHFFIRIKPIIANIRVAKTPDKRTRISGHESRVTSSHESRVAGSELRVSGCGKSRVTGELRVASLTGCGG